MALYEKKVNQFTTTIEIAQIQKNKDIIKINVEYIKIKDKIYKSKKD